MAKSKTKNFTPGDLVRYTAKFLRSTGQHASRRIDGVVVGEGRWPYVLWNDRSMPSSVGASNLEHVKTKRSREELINEARIITDLPIGLPSDTGNYRTFARKKKGDARGGPGKWEELRRYDNYGKAIEQADAAFQSRGTDTVVLTPDGFVAVTFDTFENPQRTRGKTKKGKRNANGGKLLFDGRFVQGFETPGGHLKLTPTDEGIEEARESKDHEQTFYDMFEDWIGNGWTWIPPADIGAMTDAPIISPDADLLDDGTVTIDDKSRVYWHRNYETEDPVATWAEGNAVTFALAPAENPKRGSMARGKKKGSRRSNPTTVKVRKEVAGAENRYEQATKAARQLANREGRPMYVDWSPYRKKWIIWELGGRYDQDAQILFGNRYMETLVEPQRKGNPWEPKTSVPYTKKSDAQAYADMIKQNADVKNVRLQKRGKDWHVVWAKKTKSTNPQERARNSHDPQASSRRFKYAVEAADRELTMAAEAAEKNHLGLSITRLVHASYWAGQARAEENYRGSMDRDEERRLKERLEAIERGMGQWGKNVADWLRIAS